MNWCILIPLLVGAICALLGYLLGKSLGGGENKVDVDVYKNRIAKLESDLAACKSSKSSKSSSSGAGSVASSIAAGTAAVAFNADAAKAVFGKKIKENDLTLVEGIGPKIQELFHNHDVKTWHGLSQCDVGKCQEVLNSGGERFKVHNPGTWPKQALLAAEGKWKELFDWQEELDGGK